MSQTNGMKLPRSWPPPLSSAIFPSQTCSFSLTDPCTREKVTSALDSEVAKFRTIAFAASTRRTYISQQAMYLRFCSCMDIKPVPVSSVNLGRYVAFLASKLVFFIHSPISKCGPYHASGIRIWKSIIRKLVPVLYFKRYPKVQG